ncbi:MAG: hypothetical protein DRP84_01725 [Spirochaetes bacterium]|nr:MAG: hypothetical protein DRP84_01725 [Spirochaetota bacterium]
MIKIKTSNKLNKLYLAVIVFVTFVISLWLIAKPYFGVKYNYKIGDIVQEDIVSPRNITYINVKETEKRIAEVKSRVPVVFDYRERINNEVIGTLNRFFNQLEVVNSEELSREYGLDVNLINNVKKYLENESFRRNVLDIASHIMNKGFTNLKRSDLNKFKDRGILLNKIKESEIVQEKVGINQIAAGNEIENLVKTYLRDNFITLNRTQIKSIVKIIQKFLRPNLFFNKEESSKLMESEVTKVQPVYNTIKKGAVVIRRGEEVDRFNSPKLEAITQYTNKFNARAISGIGIILMFLMFLTFMVFRTNDKEKFFKDYGIFLLFFLITVLYSYLITLIKPIPHYLNLAVLAPSAAVIMTAEILFHRKCSLALAIVVPIVLLLISGNDPYTLIFSMGSAFVSLYAVEKAEKRIDLLKSSFYILGANLLMAVGIGMLKELNFRELLLLMLWSVGNGVVSVILTLGIIPFFEILLNIPTNFRLLELSDLNNPILKKMQIEAPGTYYHSINVANMAENAARYIKANPLLVRVAALYHDIGKIPNAEYFIENNRGQNKHDLLKPSLSNSILKAHIKIGVEMAQEMKLPKEVIDIIEQHHGTSLMKYFYHQALKEKGLKNNDVDKRDYRYPGPKPQTREAAIVMLADSVEAASRVLTNPSAKRIEQMVKDIIESKFRDGQLNESSLTLRGLMKITVVFTKYLTGLFHTRIEYPDDKEIEQKETEIKKET